jgi:hypothetical protein
MAKVRRLVVVLATLAAAGVVTASASAAPPVTDTFTVKDTDTFVDVIPDCDNESLYELTLDYKLVEHTTTFEDGRIHATFTQTGTFNAVALEEGAPDASGRFTQWGGFNDSGGNVNGTFTFSVRGAYEDGTRINFHLTDHFNSTPTGAEFFWTKCHD